jgi:TonB-linked SusC/RagA family outer membrane protein
MDWLDMFKVRYSIGEVGNDYFGDLRFAYLSTIESGGSFNFGEPVSPNAYPGLYYTQVASDALTWEVARKQNLGIDINVLNNLFSFTFDVFQETRRNIYMQRSQLPGIVGINSQPWANVGKMDNRGVDGNFGVRKKIGKIDCTLRGNITWYKNKIVERDEQLNAYPYLLQKNFRAEQTRGLIALGLFADYEDIRNSPRQTYGTYMPGDIKYKDVNGDGLINDEDVVPIGASWRPALEYGMGFSASWSGLDVNVHFQGAGRNSYFLNGPTVYPFVEGAWGNILAEVTDPGNRWISKDLAGDHDNAENPNAKYPRLSYGGNANNYRSSTFWMRNGAYLRFKTMDVGYTVPAKIATRLRLSNMRVYLLAQNLMVWDDVKVWDPEMASSDGTRYPLPKTITLGMTFKF